LFEAMTEKEINAYKARLRYHANPEVYKARAYAWKIANPEKVKVHRRASRLRNIDKARAYSIAWNKANPDKVKAYKIKSRSKPENKARISAYNKAYYLRRKASMISSN
jgi:hypothetical protein